MRVGESEVLKSFSGKVWIESELVLFRMGGKWSPLIRILFPFTVTSHTRLHTIPSPLVFTHSPKSRGGEGIECVDIDT